MPMLDVTSCVWDPDIEGVRIKYARSHKPDLTFTKADIPANVVNQGMAAIDAWFDANALFAERYLFGPDAPPPYVRAKMRTMEPFKFDFVFSDNPIPDSVFDPPWHPPPPP